MCSNKSMKVEMTGRDEGCGRRAALRAAALLSRSYAIVRGAHAPSPSQAGGARNSGAILTKAGAILPNRTATPGEELHQIALDCTKLHQIALVSISPLRLHWIALDCGQLRQKIIGEKNRPEEKYPAPIFLPPSFCLQSGRGVPPPGGESPAAGCRCHISRLSYASPSQAVRDIESGWIQPAPIQVNPT
jgi:hypothetical protein